jgi:endonuclease I
LDHFAFNDLHCLVAADEKGNSLRSNGAFGEVKKGKVKQTLRDGTKKGECANHPGEQCFEVPDNIKGDIAAC